MQATGQAAGSPDKDKICCRSVQPLVYACCADALLVSTDATPELSHKVLHLKAVKSPILGRQKAAIVVAVDGSSQGVQTAGATSKTWLCHTCVA